jgi:hypothetical protein
VAPPPQAATSMFAVTASARMERFHDSPDVSWA